MSFQNASIVALFNQPSLPAHMQVPVRAVNHPAEPELDPTPAFDDATRLMDFIYFLAGRSAQKNLWINGPTGSGKSSFTRQVACRLGIPTFELGCHGGTEPSDIFGRVEPTLNGLAWVDGPMVAAMRSGGICLLDEYDLVHPTVAMGLNKVLDTRRFTIPATGELVKAHPHFRVVATSNSRGGGDASGHHRGVQTQNAAQRQRWATMHIGYMAEDRELSMLKRIALPKAGGGFDSLPELILKPMLALAQETRRLFQGEAATTGEMQPLGVIISTRVLTNWVKDAISFKGRPDLGNSDPVQHALVFNLLQGADPEDREVIEGLWKRLVGTK